MSRPPALSVVIPTRGGLAEAEHVVAALRSQVEKGQVEVVITGGPPATPPEPWVRVIPSDEPNLLKLRLLAIRESRGEVVAIGEDHAVPTPDWCEAVLRAHREHPEAAAIAGTLANGTDRTVAGRANFMAFASPWQPPLEGLYSGRTPPCSALSFKRDILAGLGGPGDLEAGLMPVLHASGRIAADGRILVDHYQDDGLRGSVVNGFHACRSSHGYAGQRIPPRARPAAAFRVVPKVFSLMTGEAWRGRRVNPGSPLDMLGVLLITSAHSLGAAVGVLAGPGRSPELTP